MENKKYNLGFGLQELPKDNRDFELGSMFSHPKISEIPTEDFIITKPLKIKNQDSSDMCVAFAICAVSEDQEEIVLGPEWFFAQAKKISGNFKSWGLNLRTACKVAVNIGFINENLQPYSLKNKDRNFLANPDNWPRYLEDSASIYRKKSYFKVGNLGKDTFDSFRIALWRHKNHRCSILTGTFWQSGWTIAKNGIIKEINGKKLYGHAFKIFGQKNIDGEIYLVAQLSNGDKIGDKGLFYFSREVVNKKFTTGAYMFFDLDPEEVKKKVWSLYRQILENIKKILKKYVS